MHLCDDRARHTHITTKYVTFHFYIFFVHESEQFYLSSHNQEKFSLLSTHAAPPRAASHTHHTYKKKLNMSKVEKKTTNNALPSYVDNMCIIIYV